MTLPASINELRPLADKLLDSGALSEEESVRLSELLQEPLAREWFLEMVGQESLLEDVFSSDDAEAKLPTVEGNIVGFSFLRLFTWSAVAMVIFCLGLWSGVSGLLPKTTKLDGLVAKSLPTRVTGLVGVVWADAEGQPGLLDGGIAPQRLALKSGLAELTYGNGVRVTIEGPCDFSITGENSAKLEHGKLVAFVPSGAEGFGVDYARGRVVDMGTEFAMDVAASGAAEIGVFDGEVRVHRPGQQTLSLLANQAVELSENATDGAVEAIPLNRDKFIRRVPTRDFRWEVQNGAVTHFSADVSHLVWKSSKYRAIFKWVRGGGIVQVQNVRLLHDGREVTVDNHVGTTSYSKAKVVGNVYELVVPKGAAQRGQWIIEGELTVVPDIKGTSKELVGIMQFEEGLVSSATTQDFIGAWTYSFAGSSYERIFSPDGTVILLRDGQPDKGGFRDARWEVKGGELMIHASNVDFVEKHVLRDRDTLIFVDSPYENAKRKEISEEK